MPSTVATAPVAALGHADDERRRGGRASCELELDDGRSEPASQFGRLGRGDHAPAVDDADRVADALDVFEDVGRHEHGRLPAQAGDEFENVPPAERVERRAGLVEEQNARRTHDGLGDPEALHHAAGVAADAAPRGAREPGHLEKLVRSASGRRRAGAEQPTGEHKQLAAGHPGVEARFLTQIADLRPQAGR